MVVSSPNSNALTSSTVAAISGRASWVIAVPNTEIVSAVHSLTKSGWWRRLRRGWVIDERVYVRRPRRRGSAAGSPAGPSTRHAGE